MCVHVVSFGMKYCEHTKSLKKSEGDHDGYVRVSMDIHVCMLKLKY